MFWDDLEENILQTKKALEWKVWDPLEGQG